MTFTVAINSGTPIEIYAGETAIDAYLDAMIGDGATAYRALAQGGDPRRRLMVAATRFIDSLGWQGAAGLSGTTLQFPRVGLMTSLGVTIADADQLAAVARATGELVALAAGDPDVLTALDSGSNIRGLGAGSSRVDFFRPTSVTDGNATYLPVPVSRIIGQWLAIAAPSAATSTASGGLSACSDFEDSDDDGDAPQRDLIRPL